MSFKGFEYRSIVVLISNLYVNGLGLFCTTIEFKVRCFDGEIVEGSLFVIKSSFVTESGICFRFVRSEEEVAVFVT